MPGPAQFTAQDKANKATSNQRYGTDYPPQGKDDEKRVKQLKRRYDQAMTAYKEKHETWESNHKVKIGKHWEPDRPTSGIPRPVDNFCRLFIEVAVSILTDARPMPTVVGTGPEDVPAAKWGENLWEFHWKKHHWDGMVAIALYDLLELSDAFAYIGWDPEYNGNQGCPVWERLHPKQVLPYSGATSIEDASGVIIARKVKLGELKRKFKDAYGLGGAYNEAADTKTPRSATGQFQIVSAADKRSGIRGRGLNDAGGDDDREELVLECYEKSYATEEFELEHEDLPPGQQPERGVRYKYPNGNLRLTIIAGDRLLQDGPSPYKHGKIPVAHARNLLMPGEVMSESDLDIMKNPQLYANRSKAWIIEWLGYTSRPNRLIPDNCRIKIRSLRPKPGQNIPYTPGPKGEKPEWEHPPPLPGELVGFNERQGQLVINEFGGLPQPARGNMPASTTSGRLVEDLQEASQTRLRPKARNLNPFLEKIAGMVLSNSMQFMTQEQTVYIAGEQGKIDYYSFYAIPKGTPPVDADGNPTGPPSEHNQMNVANLDAQGNVVADTSQQMVAKGEFDISFDADSNMPFARAKGAQNIEKFLALVQQAMQGPNPKATLELLKEYARLQRIPAGTAYIQDLLQEMNAPPAPPPPEPMHINVDYKDLPDVARIRLLKSKNLLPEEYPEDGSAPSMAATSQDVSRQQAVGVNQQKVDIEKARLQLDAQEAQQEREMSQDGQQQDFALRSRQQDSSHAIASEKLQHEKSKPAFPPAKNGG